MEAGLIRVLQDVGSLAPGGIETFIMSIYRLMDHSRVQFDFLVSREVDYFYSKEAKSLGANIYSLGIGRRNYLESKKICRSFFEDHHYSIAHFNWGSIRCPYLLYAAEQAGIRTRVIHAHSAYPKYVSASDLFNGLYHFRHRGRCVNASTHRFACSNIAARYFGFAGKEWTLIRNGIDISRFAFDDVARAEVRRELGIEDCDFCIGHIGRFSPAKNHLFLLRVFLEVLKRKPDSKLLLVGIGDLEDEVEKLIKDYDIQDEVIHLKNRRDTERLYSAMDAFAFPSLYEGLGIVAIEAQANGLPCILSEKIPHEAIVTQGVRVVPLDRGSEAWADALLSSEGSGRIDGVAEPLRDAGYDILQVVSKLQEFYLRQAAL